MIKGPLEERLEYPNSGIQRAASTILVVEDEESIRRVVERMLKTRGYEVKTASTAEEALSISRMYTGNINLLLTDMQIGNMTGTELALTMLKERKNMQIMVMTGYCTQYITDEGKLPKNVSVLSKPFTQDELISSIENIIH